MSSPRERRFDLPKPATCQTPLRKTAAPQQSPAPGAAAIADAPLPDVLRQIESEIGQEAMLQFAKAFGGQRVHIPVNARPNGQLTRALGREIAERLIALFGGGAAITVPLGPFANGRLKRAQAIALIREGKSVSDVVRATGMHEVNVRRLRARLRDAR